MHDAAFAASARPARVSILKLPMLDYSIGHELILLSEGNPLITASGADFATLPASDQIFAIQRAALVCSRTWSENRRPFRWLKLWLWFTRNANFALAIAEFRNYVVDGSSIPPLTKLGNGSEGTRLLGSPLLARVLPFVNYDYDCPLGLALWCYFSEMEMQERIGVKADAASDMPDAEEALAEQAEKLAKELKAKEGK